MTIKKNHIIGTVFSVTGLLIVSKLLGFVKQMVTASAFGATLETDLINLSQGLIGNIQYLLVQSVLSALIAVYLHTAQQGEDASRRFAFDVQDPDHGNHRWMLPTGRQAYTVPVPRSYSASGH